MDKLGLRYFSQSRWFFIKFWSIIEIFFGTAIKIKNLTERRVGRGLVGEEGAGGWWGKRGAGGLLGIFQTAPKVAIIINYDELNFQTRPRPPTLHVDCSLHVTEKSGRSRISPCFWIYMEIDGKTPKFPKFPIEKSGRNLEVAQSKSF